MFVQVRLCEWNETTRLTIWNVDILELDGRGGSYRHRGGYATFLEQRAERWSTEAQQLQAAKNMFKKEQEWMRRQPKARSTKEKARIERFSDLTSRVNYKGTKTKGIELGEVSSSRMGDVIVEFDEACLSSETRRYSTDLVTHSTSARKLAWWDRTGRVRQLSSRLSWGRRRSIPAGYPSEKRFLLDTTVKW